MMIAVLGGDMHRLARRIDDDAPAREPLADIVVGLAFEFERDAVRKPGAETLSGGARELDMDRLVREPGMAVARAISPESMAPVVRSVLLIAVSISTGRRASMRRLRRRDQLAVEHLVEPVILPLANGRSRLPAGPACGRAGEIEALAPSNAR